VAVEQLRPGLYRWTALHPAWEPGAEPDSPGDWPAQVGCVAFAHPRGLLLVDPQVPADGEPGFWAELDALVAEHGPGVTVLTTMRWHSRSRDAFAERYEAERPPIAAAEIEGVQTLPIRDADETMIWLEAPRALVPGDRLIGAPGGGVRICPQSWLGYLRPGLTVDGLRERLRPLLDLPIEMILVTHGEPVLADGRAALAAALGA
jgi:hypothetical protein